MECHPVCIDLTALRAVILPVQHFHRLPRPFGPGSRSVSPAECSWPPSPLLLSRETSALRGASRIGPADVTNSVLTEADFAELGALPLVAAPITVFEAAILPQSLLSSEGLGGARHKMQWAPKGHNLANTNELVVGRVGLEPTTKGL